MHICEDCGSNINKSISITKKWKYYGHCDSKLTCDPTRCQKEKKNNRGIHNDIANLALSDRIIDIANQLYSIVSKGIHRGNSRKGIILRVYFMHIKLMEIPKVV